MRKEIQELFPILLLVIKDSGPHNLQFLKDKNYFFESFSFDKTKWWRIEINDEKIIGFSLFNHNRSDMVFYYKGEGQIKLSYQKIGVVHSRLQELIGLVITHLPVTEYSLKHFVDSPKFA